MLEQIPLTDIKLTQHWLPLAPILIPLSAALLTLFPLERKYRANIVLFGSMLMLLASGALLLQTANGSVLSSVLGGWAAPFGIVMVGDSFSALLSFLASIAAVWSCWLMCLRPDQVREKYHLFALTSFLFAGVQLSFLTGDLFNLFVAFEVMLVASYGLAVLGSTREQLREGFRYIVMNLMASALLVTACGMMYGLMGTLNFAHLAQRSAELGPQTVVTALGMLLLVVFAAKSALFPLGFWLPGTYPALPTSTGVFFAAVLTKVGIYALIRVFVSIFPQQDLMNNALLILASVTMLYGAFGAVSQRQWRRILSFTVVASVGYLAFGIGIATVEALRATLFYLVVSVIVTVALFLLAFVAEQYSGQKEVRYGGMLEHKPLLATVFLLGALTLAGLPPTGGFVAKFALIRAGIAEGSFLSWIAVASALISSLILLYALTGIWRVFFWGKVHKPLCAVPIRQTLPAYAAALLVGILATHAGPLYQHTWKVADQLTERHRYIVGVLGREPIEIPAAPKAGEKTGKKAHGTNDKTKQKSKQETPENNKAKENAAESTDQHTDQTEQINQTEHTEEY